MIRIKVLLPDKARDRETLDKREEMLKNATSCDVELSVDNIKAGPNDLDSCTDEVLASEDMLRQARRAQSDGFDAVVIYCFSDVAIDAIRENLSVPVIGAGETSVGVANLICSRFAVVTAGEANISRTYRKLRKNCVVRDKMTSVFALDVRMADIWENRELMERSLFEAAERVVKSERIDGLILGCLGFAGMGGPIEKELGISVIDPAFVAVGFAEIAARLGLKHSAKNYSPYTKLKLN